MTIHCNGFWRLHHKPLERGSE
jgi:hypothetical protein